MNKFMKVVTVGAISVMLTACGKLVEVPSAHVAKVIDEKGFQDTTYTQSRFRLQSCALPGQVCEQLVIADVSDRSVDESFKLVMPRDRLEMDFDIGITYTIDRTKVDDLFHSLNTVKTEDSRIKKISIESAYNTYARPIILTETRNFLSQFSIEEVLTNRTEVSNDLRQHLIDRVEEQTSFIVINVGLNKASPPPVIVESQLNTARHRENIRVEEQNQEVAMIRLEREYNNARMERKIEVEQADATAEVNRILGDSMTEDYRAFRTLEILEAMANSSNKTFIPVEMLGTMAAQNLVSQQ